MNYTERYALSCGSKIDSPWIYEKFFPLPIEKFITFHPVSKPAKTYDYFADVIEDLYPVLESHGIKIIQVGAAADHKFERCVKVCGMTTVNQVAYIVRRSLLHLSADTFSAHMAGAFDKKLVALYSSNYIQNSQPYWGKPEDQILLEPARINGEKPSFAFDEHPKSINTIKSETISNAVFKLLGLTERANYETVFIGEKYQNQQYFHNIVPNDKGVLVNQAETELRFDLNPNEDFLARQLNHAKSAIITDRPINLNLLKQLKPKISFLFYFVSDASGVEFCKSVIGLGIPIMLVSKLPQDKINDLKIHYYDLAKIDKIPEISAEDSSRIKSLPLDKLRIKTNKIYTFEQKHFYSTPDYKNDHPCIIPNFKPVTSGSEAELNEVLTDFQFTKLIKVLD